MKLVSLTLENFINHKLSTLLNLAPINIVYGENGAGKSAIKDALRWMIVGRARGMTRIDDRQREQELIRLEEKKTTVTLIYEDGQAPWEIKKAKTASTLSLKLNDQPKEQRDIWKLFGSDEKKLEAALSGETFLSKSLKERKQFIFNLMGVEVTKESVNDLLRNKGIHDSNLLDMVVKKVFDDSFEKAKGWAEEERRVWKRKEKEFQHIEQPKDSLIEIKENKISLSVLDVEELETQIIKGENARSELLVKKGRLEQTGDSAKQVVKLDAEKANLIGQKLQLEQNIEKWDIEKLGKSLEKFKKEQFEFNQEIKNHGNNYQKIRGQIEILEVQISKLDEISERCPTCLREMTEEVKTNLFQKFEEERTKLEEQCVDIQKEMEKITNMLNKIVREIMDKERILAECEKDRNDLNKILEKIEEINDRIKEIERTGKLAQGDLNDINSRIQKLDEALQRGRNIIIQARDFQRQKGEFEKSQTRRKEAQEKIICYDQLAQLLGPDGIIKEILAKALTPFRERIKKVSLDILPGVEVDDDLEFKIGEKTESMLSDSETLRLSWIVQEAIAYFAQLRICILDSVDRLDKVNRGKLLRMAYQLLEEYDTIILILTGNEIQVVKDEKFRFFKVENGNIIKGNEL